MPMHESAPPVDVAAIRARAARAAEERAAYAHFGVEVTAYPEAVASSLDVPVLLDLLDRSVTFDEDAIRTLLKAHFHGRWSRVPGHRYEADEDDEGCVTREYCTCGLDMDLSGFWRHSEELTLSALIAGIRAAVVPTPA